MRLVLVHPPGQACTTLRALSSAEIAVIERHVRAGIAEPGMPSWLVELARAGVWIACDCRGRNEPPLMFVRKVSRSHHVLMPMPDRPPHATRCPVGEAFARRSLSIEPSYCELRKLLYRWFAAARLNLRFPYGRDHEMSVQYEALREISRSLPWVGRQPLYEFSRTHPQGLPQLCRTLCRANQTQRRGLFLGVSASAAPAILRGMLQPDAQCREWLQAVELPVAEPPMDNDVKGPFVVIFELEGSASGVIRIEHVVLQPVHSERVLVPVEAERERYTLELLLQVQQEMFAHRQIVTLRKTLADSLIHERGVAFQLQPLGPNGRALRTIDVVSADATVASQCRGPMENQAEPLYHVVDAPPCSDSAADRSFRRRVLSLLCDPPKAKADRRAAMPVDG
jgi:hypothetical protein